jgi:hypothetical protein
MSRDDTLQIAGDLLGEVERAAVLLSATTATSDKVEAAVDDFSRRFGGANSSQAEMMTAAGAFGRLAASYTHDVEVLVAQDRLTTLLGDVQLSPIQFDQGPHSVEATPTGSPRIFWSAPKRPRVMQDCLCLETSWDVIIDGGDRVGVIMIHQVILVVDMESQSIGVLETNAPRFVANDGSPADPLRMLPRQDGLRATCREKLFGEVSHALSQIIAPVPTDANSYLPSAFRPHFYHVSQTLGFAARTLPKRRKPFALWRWPISFNQAIRIHGDHLRPRITSIAAGQGLGVEGIDFKHGFIELRVHRSESRSVLYITVEVNVWLTYAIRFPEDLPAMLFTEAVQTYWRYHWKSDFCWPVCGDVGRETEKQIMDQINKAQLLTFPFEDFSDRAWHARTSIDPFGVLIMLEAYDAN